MTKRNRGHCNVCKTDGKLTNDHVPPQGSYPARRVWVQSVAPTLQPPDPGIRHGSCRRMG